MFPIKTKRCNITLVGGANVDDCPAEVVKTELGRMYRVTWQLTAEERDLFLRTGQITLEVLTQQFPPVSLYVDAPEASGATQ